VADCGQLIPRGLGLFVGLHIGVPVSLALPTGVVTLGLELRSDAFEFADLGAEFVELGILPADLVAVGVQAVGMPLLVLFDSCGELADGGSMVSFGRGEFSLEFIPLGFDYAGALGILRGGAGQPRVALSKSSNFIL